MTGSTGGESVFVALRGTDVNVEDRDDDHWRRRWERKRERKGKKKRGRERGELTFARDAPRRRGGRGGGGGGGGRRRRRHRRVVDEGPHAVRRTPVSFKGRRTSPLPP